MKLPPASLCWLPARYLNFPYWTFFPDWNTSARNDCYTVRLGQCGWVSEREKSNNFSRRGRGTAEERLTVNAREVFYNVRS